MKALRKKPLTIVGIVAIIVLIFVLLTTVGKPLFMKSVTAQKIDDLRNVCYNSETTNAAAYSTPKSAVVAGFYEAPYSDNNPWQAILTDSSSYYAHSGEQEKVNVVACFEHQPFAAKQIATCSSDIKLMSAHYKTIFYEAKTGKKITEGKELVNDNATCPSYVVYNTTSRQTAKAPDVNDMQAAIKAFVEQ